MGFFDGLLDTLTLGAYSAVTDLIGTPTRMMSERRQVNASKELLNEQTQNAMALQEHQFQLGKEGFKYQFGNEAGLNAYLMRTSPSIQKQASIDAGVNPASNFGAFSGNLAQASMPLPNGSSSAPSVNFPQGNAMELLNLAQKQPLVRAEADLTSAKARAQELENKAMEEENVFYSNFDRLYDFNVENGRLIIKPKEGANIPEFFTNPATTRKGVEAKHLSFSRVMKELAKNNADISQDELRQKVAQGQIENSLVMQALIEMPEIDFKKVRQEYFNLIKTGVLQELDMQYNQKRNDFELPEQKLKDLEFKIKEKTNIADLIGRFTNGTWTIGDLIYALVMAFSVR